MSDYILRLVQRRLHDKNAEITQEEIGAAQEQLYTKLSYLQTKIEILLNRQKLLERLIHKDDLYKTTSDEIHLNKIIK